MARQDLKYEQKTLAVQVHTGHGQEGIRITIEDIPSRLTVCTLEIPREKIGGALFGAGSKATATVHMNPNFGKEFEIEHFQSWLPNRFGHGHHQSETEWYESCCKLLREGWECDDWQVDYSLLKNTNNIIRTTRNKDIPPPSGKKPDEGNWWGLHRYRWVDKITKAQLDSER